MRKSSVLIFALCVSVAACTPSLKTDGRVAVSLQNANGELAKIAMTRGIALEMKTSTENWYPRFKADQKNSSVAQLYGAEWGRELIFLSNENSLADSGATWGRASFSKSEPSWFLNLDLGPKNGFIPTTSYLWGLFFNEKNLADIGGQAPKNIDELEAMFAKAKAKGITPIALGANYGWPAAAWFTILDLRMNGATAVRERYAGKRPWNDSSALAVAAKLASWRDSGYFNADLASTGMPEAITAMETGQSLCNLMGAFAVERLQKVGTSRFIAFPAGTAKVGRAEIGGLSGFALPRAGFSAGQDGKPSIAAESALALVSAYIEAGSPDERIDSYRVPVAYSAKRDYKLPKLQGVRATELEALKSCAAILPSFDRAVSPQALQNSIPLWTRFFSTPEMKAKDFLDSLQKDIEGSK
jgi:ABC-type sugar transport system, periplasmic component